ncbi:MAG: hypothetical protein FD127_245 [Acidimicrobiaceae bacterium]|nr:MAG: hypothetical protein FD127_245 [Acidimicrobiaceae bacterium]
MSADTTHEPRRVLPRFPELDTEPFWEATKEHQLRYQFCEQCETVIFYPRAHCTKCTNTDLTWRTSSGEGAIYTYSVIRRSQHPSFMDMVPYVIAWVDLDETFRMLTHIVDVDPDDPESGLTIGARVQVHWIDRGQVSLPAFHLA